MQAGDDHCFWTTEAKGQGYQGQTQPQYFCLIISADCVDGSVTSLRTTETHFFLLKTYNHTFLVLIVITEASPLIEHKSLQSWLQNCLGNPFFLCSFFLLLSSNKETETNLKTMTTALINKQISKTNSNNDQTKTFQMDMGYG
jgi:hypothetical protein